MVRKVEFFLADAFEVTGQWWLHETPEEQLYGTLRYACTHIELELSGTLNDGSASDRFRGSGRFNDHLCIHGLTNDGQKFTLLRAGAFSIGATTRYSAFHIIADKHVPALAEFKLRAISFYCRHLDPFLARQLFSVESEGEKEDFKSLTVQYSQPPKLVWRID